MAQAMSKLIQPLARKTIVRAMAALDACRIMVSTAPTTVKMSTLPKPKLVRFFTKARASG